MKTIVCIKELGKAADLNALTEAVRISNEVMAVTMGPESAKIVAGEALARGADNGVLITDKALRDSDTLVTAKVLARAIELSGDYDMILLGNESDDSRTAQVGPMIAEFLGIEQITNVMEITDGRAVKIMDGKKVTVKFNYPVLITVNKRINEPDVFNMGGIFNDKDIKTLTLADLGIDPENVGTSGSPTRITGEYDAGLETNGVWVNSQELVEALKDERAI